MPQPSSPGPPRTRFCTAPDGARIAWEALGTGPPIVKSANWMSHLEVERRSPLSRHWLDLLSGGRTLIRFDGRGYGMSDRRPPTLTFEAMVSDLEAVADAAELERFPIVAFCHGGPIAIAYAARHPERVAALVLCGTYLEGRARRDASPREAAERELLLRLIEIGWGQDNPAYRQVFATTAVPSATAEVFTAFCEIQRASASPQEAVALTHLFWGIDVRDEAARVRCPTLVLHATADGVVPFEQGRQLAAVIERARLVSLDSRNHDLLADEPAWPVFCREVEAFLAEHAAAPSADVMRRLDQLSVRERAVLDGIARGLDNHEIAKRLFLSEKTIRNHVTRIFDKLDFASRGRAIVWARDAGLGRDGRAPG